MQIRAIEGPSDCDSLRLSLFKNHQIEYDVFIVVLLQIGEVDHNLKKSNITLGALTLKLAF